MPSCRHAVAFALFVLPTSPAAAQRIRELQVHGLTTFATERFAGGGIALGIRPPGRLGLSLGASAGSLEGVPAARLEGLVIFRVSPSATAGARPYASAGVALLAREAGSDGYITLVLGAESRPAGRRGWFVELGVGGGVRVAAGIRLRRVLPVTRR
jgi:hypothetical protein